MKQLTHVFLILTLACARLFGGTLEPVLLEESDEQLWISSPKVEIYVDSTNELTLEEVLETNQANFNFPPEEFLSDMSNTNCWLHISVIDKRKTNKPYRLEFYDFNINEIEFFWLDDNHIHSKKVTGFNQNFFSREVLHKNVSLNLDFIKNDTTEIYIRTKTNHINLLKPVIRSYDDFFNYGLTEYLFFGVFFGLFFFIILYNLIYFFILRVQHYIYYVMYALGITIYLMSKNGTGFQYLWPNLPWINIHADHAGLYIGVTGLLLFSSNFLKLKRKRPALFKTVLVILFVQTFFLFFEVYVHSFWFDEFIELLIIQFVFTLGFTIRKEGGIAFKSYIIAFIILNISFLISYLESLNLIPSNAFTVYALYLGFFIQYFALSISIAERTRNSLKQKNKAQKELLDFKEIANKELEEKVKQRTNQIQEHQSIIEAKNKHILDSVRYAKNIQQAMLPSQEELLALNKDHFVINIPRDIVSGDFYWKHEINEDEFLLVVADCTGHGVPGALMSMIGSSSLNNIVAEKIYAPSKLLLTLHEKINHVLRQSETKNEDGMDLVVLRINKKEKQVTFSGAKNPILVLQNEKVTRVKGSKSSVGGNQNKVNTTFESHVLHYSEEEPLRLLLYSDGIIDQFGGPNDRKYGSRQLTTFLKRNRKTDLTSFKMLLQNEIVHWKGSASQIDDILVVGIDLK